MKPNPPRKIFTIISILLLVSFSYIEARALQLETISSTWTEVIGGHNISGIGTEEIRWGIPAFDESSGLRFDAVETPREVTLDSTFALGQLTHFNWPVYLPASEASLALNIVIDSLEYVFDLVFQIDETVNWPTMQPDVITWSIPNNQGLDLIGFGESGNLSSNFVTDEMGESTATLWASLNSNIRTIAVDEPANLLVIGLFLTALVLYKRKTKGKV